VYAGPPSHDSIPEQLAGKLGAFRKARIETCSDGYCIARLGGRPLLVEKANGGELTVYIAPNGSIYHVKTRSVSPEASCVEAGTRERRGIQAAMHCPPSPAY
jgi:hypothetical protein